VGSEQLGQVQENSIFTAGSFGLAGDPDPPPQPLLQTARTTILATKRTAILHVAFLCICSSFCGRLVFIVPLAPLYHHDLFILQAQLSCASSWGLRRARQSQATICLLSLSFAETRPNKNQVPLAIYNFFHKANS
jgi:hypothetical protein